MFLFVASWLLLGVVLLAALTSISWVAEWANSLEDDWVLTRLLCLVVLPSFFFVVLLAELLDRDRTGWVALSELLGVIFRGRR